MRLSRTAKYLFLTFYHYLVDKKGSANLIKFLSILDEPITEAEFDKKLMEVTILNTSVQHQLDENYLLGLCAYLGLGVVEDRNHAFQLFQKGCISQHAPSEYMMGVFYENGFVVPKDLTQSFQCQSKSAAKHFPPALVALAMHYEHGWGCKADLVRAINLYEASALKKDPVGLYEYGKQFAFGKGRVVDTKKAIEYYSLAADLDNLDAQWELFCHYGRGQVITQDLQLAEKYLLQAVEQDHPEAIHKRGIWWEMGIQCKSDLKQAFVFYERAVALDYKPAFSDLARCYFYGFGIARNDKKAFELFYQAFVSGDVDAAPYLAKLYYKGKEVFENWLMAFDLVRMSALRGLAWGYGNLSKFYSKGFKDQPSDLVRSCLLLLASLEKEEDLAFRRLLQQLQITDPNLPQDLKKSVESYSLVSQQPSEVKTKSEQEALSCKRARAYDLLGFCYAFGLGVKQDINKAIDYYKQAILLGSVVSHSDYWLCYVFSGVVTMNIEDAIQFYQELEKIHQDKMAIQKLALINERGIKAVPQNLFYAYNKYDALFALDLNDQASAEKSENFLKLKVLDNTIHSSLLLWQFPKNLTQIVAEYALEDSSRKRPEILL